jgi:hypothetical protein
MCSPEQSYVLSGTDNCGPTAKEYSNFRILERYRNCTHLALGRTRGVVCDLFVTMVLEA